MKILTVFGTRPEAIKMAPVISALDNDTDIIHKTCVSAQHRDMLDQVISFFNITIDYDLNIMRTDQSLTETTAAILNELANIIKDEQPDMILVHGDTNTTMAASLVAFFHKIRIGHVEAGLRTYDLQAPWPEEANRRITDLLSNQYFAPTEHAKNNLTREGVETTSITVTGNTVIDALLMAQRKIQDDTSLNETLQNRYAFLDQGKKLILVTGHRRENFGEGLSSICLAIQDIAKFGDTEIVYPVHRNPNVQSTVQDMLDGTPGVHLIDPLDYPDFVYLMDRSYLILTDSGGIQEEAPALDKPVLVMRDVTERPEGIDAGTLKLVGTIREKIIKNVHTLLTDKAAYSAMANAVNPYGDGMAAMKIVDAIKHDT